MEKAINDAFAANEAAIRAHFAVGGARTRMPSNAAPLPAFDTTKPIGEGFTNTGTVKNPVSAVVDPTKVTKVQLVFDPDPLVPGGFRLVTAFPVFP